MTKLVLGLIAMFVLGVESKASAQKVETLPKGVGLYRLGYRDYGHQTNAYDEDGNFSPIGSRFDKSFNGKTMLDGSSGSELQKLAGVLKEFDGKNGGGLLDTITLGELTGEVDAQVQSKFFGLAFGLRDKLTLFGGLPFVNAKVDTKLHVSGINNADQIRQSLGQAAFSQLEDGLKKAALLDSAQIAANIEEKGYAPVEHWEHSDIGDARVGIKTGWAKRLGSGMGYALNLTHTLEMPTGYVEDPNILTDVSFGKGYYSFSNSADQKFGFLKYFYLGIDTTYAKNFQTTMHKRVPDGQEHLPDVDRLADVKMTPGDDVSYGGSVGAHAGSFGSFYRIGRSRHFGDRYSGSLAGDYGRLSEHSDSSLTTQTVGAEWNTASAYQRHRFPVPFILQASYQKPIAGVNSSSQQYFEISIASFFSTPMAKSRDKDRSDERETAKRSRKSEKHAQAH